jgi:hypothetical protein
MIRQQILSAILIFAAGYIVWVTAVFFKRTKKENKKNYNK